MKKMKFPVFSLTFLVAFLPALFFHFNNTQKVTEQSHFFKKGQAELFADICFSDSTSGKYIKEPQNCTDYQIRKIVIDPGHGGRDGGCSGAHSSEKHVSLNIALLVGKAIETHFPEVEVIYTRKTDVFVPLHKRAELANKNNADLFISIHCNFIPNASHVDGSETYVLGLHRADDNLAVAKRENAAIFYEENYQQNYDGYDPNTPEGHIILSMFQNAYLEQSIALANKIENNIQNDAGRKSRGVKQAGFLVLRNTTMPSVLVESGYLSNTSDDLFLSTDHGQQLIAQAIFNAFSEYKSEIEGTLAGFTKKELYTNSAPIAYTPDRPKTVHEPKMVKSPTRKAAPKIEATPPKNLKPSLIIPSKNDTPVEYEVVQEKSPGNTGEVKFKVLLEVTDRLADTEQSKWKNLDYTIQVLKEGNTIRYLAIGFQSYTEASEAKNRLRKSGFEEAFVVAYQNGKRIDIEKALKLSR